MAEADPKCVHPRACFHPLLQLCTPKFSPVVPATPREYMGRKNAVNFQLSEGPNVCFLWDPLLAGLPSSFSPWYCPQHSSEYHFCHLGVRQEQVRREKLANFFLECIKLPNSPKWERCAHVIDQGDCGGFKMCPESLGEPLFQRQSHIPLPRV